MQTLTFENYQGPIMFHWYVLSLKALFCLKKFEYVHIIHCKENVVYLSPNTSFSIHSVLFLLYSVTPVDSPLIKGRTVCLFVCYFSKTRNCMRM